MARRSTLSRLAVKAMGIFGGVQVAGILCSIVRTKLVAMWIGPVGVGLFGLFNQALDTIITAVGLGIRQSSVRDVSQALEQGHTGAIARIVTVVRRWSLWLGLAGTLLTMALAPLLSEWTFGDQDHVWGFVALSAAVLFMTVTNGEYAVLQGLQKLKRLASVTLWGTIFGLAVSIPLFYYLREQSILPSILAYAAGNLLFAWLLRNRDYKPVAIGARETLQVGSGFVKLGIYMTLGNFVTMLAAYIFNAWLYHMAGSEMVGYYQAGYTLVNKYTGLVLTALGMEYYPRLAKVAEGKIRLRAYVSQEINISLLVMAPILCIFILLRSQVVWLLYSPKFLVILTFVSWGMIGMVMRTLSWCLAFVILAKGDGRTYLVTESLSAVTGLALNIAGYHYWGLTGLGISFLVWYVVYTAIVWVVYAYRYRLTLINGCLLNVVWTLAVSALAMLGMEQGMWWLALLATLVAAAVTVYHLKRLL